MGVLLGGQVQYRVGGVQIGQPASPVGDPRHDHLPEPGGQSPFTSILGSTPLNAIDVDDLVQARLPAGAKVQAVLEQLAQQRQPIGVQTFLHLRVGHSRVLFIAKPRHHRGEPRL